MNRCVLTAGIGVLGLLAIVGTRVHAPGRRAHGPLDQQAYVWQRDWRPAVRGAVAQAGTTRLPLAVLAAEVA